MIAIICLFCPHALMAYFLERWECVNKRQGNGQWTRKQYVFNYIVSLLVINYISLSILSFIVKNNDDLLIKLDRYNDFAVKYMSLSCCFAIAIPYAIHVYKYKIRLLFSPLDHKLDRFHWRLFAALYAFALFLLNFIRVFDGYFWLDEAWSLYLSKLSMGEMILETAQDVHPPLYYMILQVACKIGGYEDVVYHVVSLFPYVSILVISLTFIWKRFGKEAAFILITLSSLLPNAVQFNVEVRMYSWGALFVLLSYLALYEILTVGRRRDHIVFTFFSLAASYTHYYCLITVSFFYLILLLWAIKKRSSYLMRVMLVCVLTAIGYLPWFFTLIRSFKRVSDGFWISSIPAFKDCIGYLFSCRYQYVFALIMFVGSLWLFLYELKIVKMKRTEDGRLEILVDLSSVEISDTAIWVSAGWSGIFGTMLVGIIVSGLVRPLFFLRYLYPATIIAWLLLGFIITKCKRKTLYSVSIVVLIFIACVPQYKDIYRYESSLNDKLKTTLAATVDEIDTDDVILTDIWYLDSPILDHYYPEVEHHLIDLSVMPRSGDGKTYWLILSSVIKEDLYDHLIEQGYFCEEIVNGGSLGNHTVYIYRAGRG